MYHLTAWYYLAENYANWMFDCQRTFNNCVCSSAHSRLTAYHVLLLLQLQLPKLHSIWQTAAISVLGNRRFTQR